MKDRVVIVTEGGLIRNIASDKDVEIIIVDVDQIQEGDDDEVSLNYGKPDEIGKAAVNAVIQDGEDLVEKELKMRKGRGR